MSRRAWCPPLFAQHDGASTPSPAEPPSRSHLANSPNEDDLAAASASVAAASTADGSGGESRADGDGGASRADGNGGESTPSLLQSGLRLLGLGGVSARRELGPEATMEDVRNIQIALESLADAGE